MFEKPIGSFRKPTSFLATKSITAIAGGRQHGRHGRRRILLRQRQVDRKQQLLEKYESSSKEEKEYPSSHLVGVADGAVVDFIDGVVLSIRYRHQRWNRCARSIEWVFPAAAKE